MANTKLSNPVTVASNSDPAPLNVNVLPSNGTLGSYTWRCVGQKDTGSVSTITFSVNGLATGPSIVAGTDNYVGATCQVKAATTNYVRVTATFVSPSNNLNWTIWIGTGTGNYVKFTRGTGGGATPKPTRKTTVKKAAKPARKVSAKAAKKAAPKKAAPKKAARKKAALKKAAPKAAKKKVAAKSAKKRGK